MDLDIYWNTQTAELAVLGFTLVKSYNIQGLFFVYLNNRHDFIKGTLSFHKIPREGFFPLENLTKHLKPDITCYNHSPPPLVKIKQKLNQCKAYLGRDSVMDGRVLFASQNPNYLNK